MCRYIYWTIWDYLNLIFMGTALTGYIDRLGRAAFTWSARRHHRSEGLPSLTIFFT